MKTLREYAMTFVGTNYKWGGNNAIEGMDCSGFVEELLNSVGCSPKGRDSSQSLYNYFKIYGKPVERRPFMGCLLFFGKGPTEIIHVAMALSPHQMIEAGGGGANVIDRITAAEKNAVVRIRAIKNRSDLVAAIFPNYETWVLEDV